MQFLLWSASRAPVIAVARFFPSLSLPSVLLVRFSSWWYPFCTGRFLVRVNRKEIPMEPYMFVIKSVPLPNSRHYRTIRQALVHIWVMDSDIDSARENALSYIRSLNWNPLLVEHALEIQKEQISRLPEEEAVLYQKALCGGIAADFLASPIRERPSGSPVEFDVP